MYRPLPKEAIAAARKSTCGKSVKDGVACAHMLDQHIFIFMSFAAFPSFIQSFPSLSF